MNKIVYLTFVMLLGLNLAWALSPVVRDEIHWQLALLEYASMESYLELRPNGRHLDKIKKLQDDAAWDRALHANNIKAYKTYIDQPYTGKYTEIAKKNIESIYWEKASTSNTVSAYHDYLSMYTNGQFSDKAKVALTALELSQPSKKNKKDHAVFVRDLQKKLYSLGYNPGPVDGVFGGSSKKALRKFQADNKIKITGQPDLATLKLLGFL